MPEFGAHLDRAAISGVVRDGLRDLQCSPAAARVVGLERLARNRLIALIEQGESPQPFKLSRRCNGYGIARAYAGLVPSYVVLGEGVDHE